MLLCECFVCACVVRVVRVVRVCVLCVCVCVCVPVPVTLCVSVFLLVLSTELCVSTWRTVWQAERERGGCEPVQDCSF